MRTEELRPRLDRVQELSKKLNAATDDASRIVHGVEVFLSDVCHVGMAASIFLDQQGEEFGPTMSWWLEYDRYGSAFRIYVRSVFSDEPDQPSLTLWSNCTRELKLLAYGNLYKLLDKIIEELDAKILMVQENTESIESLLPSAKGKKKGATS